MQTLMFYKKNFNVLAFMPSGSVNIEPDSIFRQSSVQMPQALDKTLPVTLGRFYHSSFTFQRSNPPENIKPGMMSTGSWNPQPFSFLRPAYSQPGMQGKTCFILKHNGLIGFQFPEFFLMPSEISSHHDSEPEHMNNWHVSNDIQNDASSIVPDVPLDVSQRCVLNELPMSDHPTVPCLTQNQQDSSLNVPPTACEPLTLTEPDDQTLTLPVIPAVLLHLPCASMYSNFDASNLILRLSIRDADPPVSAVKPLSLSRYRLPELPEHRSEDALGLLPDASTLTWGFS